jgi:hypothetical protein
MNNLLVGIIGDNAEVNHRKFSKMLYMNAANQHYGNFANYELTKGVTTKKLIRWFNYDEAWTYSFWVRGLIYFSTAGTNGLVAVKINMTSDYLQVNNEPGAFNKLKANSTNFGGLVNKHICLTNVGNGSAFGCKIYHQGFLVENIQTPVVLDTSLPYDINIYNLNQFGGLNRSSDSGDIPNPQYITGGFADFRAWNAALTPKEVYELYAGGWQKDIRNGDLLFRLPATDASLHFDIVSSKTRVLDTSGNNNHLIMENMPTPNLVNFL